MPYEILTAANLAEQPQLRHAFFTKPWGIGRFSSPVIDAGASEAWAAMALKLGVAPQHFLSCHQIHSPTVVTIGAEWSSQNNPQADAMVTNKAGVALGILTADCVPVLFTDSQNHVIGAAHAGWRGALGGVLENTLDAMEKLGAKRQDTKAALGPCIWQDSYEVGPDFPAAFLAEDEANNSFFAPSMNKGRYQFDLPGYVVAKLRKLGCGDVALSPADTCAEPERFYSHRYSTLRGEQREGNIVSAISLVN